MHVPSRPMLITISVVSLFLCILLTLALLGYVGYLYMSVFYVQPHESYATRMNRAGQITKSQEDAISMASMASIPFVTWRDCLRPAAEASNRRVCAKTDLPAPSRPPIILFNGMGGSRLEARRQNEETHEPIGEWYNLWITEGALLPSGVNEWARKGGALRWVDGELENMPGISTRVPRFGDPFALSTLGTVFGNEAVYMEPLIADLCNQGSYVIGKSLFAAAYDFRMVISPSYWAGYVSRTTTLIEQAVLANENKKAVLIGHSLGCPVIQWFLHAKGAEWNNAHIAYNVNICGAFGGAGKAMQAAVFGVPVGLPTIRLVDKRVESLYSGVVSMLPSPLVFGSDMPAVTLNSRQWPLSHIDDMFIFLNNPTTRDVFHELVTVPNRMEQLITPPPGAQVKTLLITASTTDTDLMYMAVTDVDNPVTVGEVAWYRQLKEAGDSRFNSVRSEADWLQHVGDGTVNYLSQRVPVHLWPAARRPQSSQIMHLDHTDHVSAAQSPKVAPFVLNIVLND